MNVKSLVNMINTTTPYAWDDSLGVYEFLGKIVSKLNEVVDEVNLKLPDGFELAFYEKFREYTKDEIAELVSSGEFETMITNILTGVNETKDEVIEARQGALNLGENITEVKSQLAETARKTSGIITLDDFPNVKGDGLTDDTAAIQQAFNDFSALGEGFTLLIPNKTYLISNVVFEPSNNCTLDFKGKFISNATSGVAFKVGSNSKGTSYLTTSGISISAKTNQWANGVIGIQFLNTTLCNLGYVIIQGFYKNIEFNAVGRGNTFNKVYCGMSQGGKKSLFLTASNGGWCNENIFFGGEFRYNSSDPVDSDCCLITIDNYHEHGLNSNHFYSPSLEGGQDRGANAVSISGNFNQLIFPRLELSGKIMFTAQSQQNFTLLGFDNFVNEIIVDEGSMNSSQSAKHLDIKSGIDGVLSLQNIGSSSKKNITSKNTTGVETFYVAATGELHSNSTGYFESGIRFSADGSGKNRGVFSGNGSPEGVVSASSGSIYMNRSGGSGTTIYVKESTGFTNIGWVAK